MFSTDLTGEYQVYDGLTNAMVYDEKYSNCIHKGLDQCCYHTLLEEFQFKIREFCQNEFGYINGQFIYNYTKPGEDPVVGKVIIDKNEFYGTKKRLTGQIIIPEFRAYMEKPQTPMTCPEIKNILIQNNII